MTAIAANPLCGGCEVLYFEWQVATVVAFLTVLRYTILHRLKKPSFALGLPTVRKELRCKLEALNKMLGCHRRKTD
jgi:hypothetical protein